jgi:outer membrane protein OmpA-like peptidoglycan-associated protein
LSAWDILVSQTPGGDYEVCVRFPGAPNDGYTFIRKLPPDFSDFFISEGPEGKRRNWRRPLGAASDEDLLFCAADLSTLKDIGARLYDALFHDDTPGAPKGFTDAFLALRETADPEAGGLHLNIDLNKAPALARVPWEALYVAPKDLFLGIDTNTNIVRILSPDRIGSLPKPIVPPVRLLVIVANPEGDLETGAEIANIEKRLNGLLGEGGSDYQVEILSAATRSRFGDKIEDWKPHIIHFIGHGGFYDEKGLIYLHDERDPLRRDAIDSATLRDLVINDQPWLVVLNSCLGGTAAKVDPFGGAAHNLIRVNVPFVVAMQASVSDEAAIRFSQRFYASLARDNSVASAVTRGRNAIRALGEKSLQAELITPVLYSSGKSDVIDIRKPPSIDIPNREVGIVGRILQKIDRPIQIGAGLAAIVGLFIMVWQVADRPKPTKVQAVEIAGRVSVPTRPDDKAGGDLARGQAGAAASPPAGVEEPSADVSDLMAADGVRYRLEPPDGRYLEIATDNLVSDAPDAGQESADLARAADERRAETIERMARERSASASGREALERGEAAARRAASGDPRRTQSRPHAPRPATAIASLRRARTDPRPPRRVVVRTTSPAPVPSTAAPPPAAFAMPAPPAPSPAPSAMTVPPAGPAAGSGSAELSSVVSAAVGASALAYARVGPVEAEEDRDVIMTGSYSPAERRRIELWRRTVRDSYRQAYSSGRDSGTAFSRLSGLTDAVAESFGWSVSLEEFAREEGVVGGPYEDAPVDPSHAFHYVFFPARSAAVGPEAAVLLDRLALQIDGSQRLRVAGHTGGSGAAEFERRLSDRRVDAVIDYLDRRGRRPAEIVRAALGARQPLLPRASTELSRLDNRVEIVVEPLAEAAGEAPPVARRVAAYFDEGLDRPNAVSIYSELMALMPASNRDLEVLLTGYADPPELADRPGLALARAQRVAEQFRGWDVATERIRTETAAEDLAAAEVPVERYPSLRRVEVRLVLRGAELVGARPGESELAPDAGPILDRLVFWILLRQGFSLHLEPVAADGESDPLARARAERVRAELQRRAVPVERIRIAPAAARGAGEAGVRVFLVPLSEP